MICPCCYSFAPHRQNLPLLPPVSRFPFPISHFPFPIFHFRLMFHVLHVDVVLQLFSTTNGFRAFATLGIAQESQPPKSFVMSSFRQPYAFTSRSHAEFPSPKAASSCDTHRVHNYSNDGRSRNCLALEPVYFTAPRPKSSRSAAFRPRDERSGLFVFI